VRELLFVGTSDAFGSGGRRQSAYLVRGASGTALLDCGSTTLTGLSALGIDRNEIDTISVSHFHADHFGGIPLFLLAAMFEDGRKKPLYIVGPEGLEKRVRTAAMALGHPIERHDWSFPLHFIELATGETREVGPVTLRPFATHHSPDVNPHGFVVRNGRQQIAYSGDTGWFPELPQKVAGSEVFICECTQVKRDYAYHLSLEELAERPDVFDCGRLVLTHLGPAMRELTDHGGFEIADDGLSIKL
jgi:ribonuclease BN (tRNA processing enzyme)